MQRSAQLQFSRMTPEAQRAALHRLALGGMTADEIAQVTGWPINDVRQFMPTSTTPSTWVRQRMTPG